ncbi:hypothetical protein KAR02_06315 [Candidatus Bipolaricaulota bacterium]|nr:hypothetical protein [Candidatus Bipolaricaulota bacterium]
MNRRTSIAILALILLCVAELGSVTSPNARLSSVGTRASESHSIALTADGGILVVVNPDSNSISILDTGTLVVEVEIVVGVAPQTVAVEGQGRHAYVACQGSDYVAVVDLASHKVVDTWSVGDRPIGVALSPNERVLAVSELGEDVIRLIDVTSSETIATVPVPDRPYGLAFTPQGTSLVVTHLLRGDVTIVDLDKLSCAFIPTWMNVAPAPAVAINAEGSRAYLPQTMAHGLGRNTQFDNTVFAKVSVIDLQDSIHATAEHISLPEKDQPVGLPWDVSLAKGGTELWVVNAASNDVSILSIEDPKRPRRVAHIAVSHNPRGIVIDEARGRAYVANSLAGSVSVIDTNLYEIVDEVLVTKNPLPPILLTGKRLFHTSVPGTVAKAAWTSCNTCHIEGEHDGRTWLLQYTGDVPIGADPVVRRNTTSLLGMIETYPLRWSAEWDESADSEFSIRLEQFGTGLIEGQMHPTLGTPNQGRSYELDSLATFIDSLGLPERQHTLTAAEERGKALFESELTECIVCHPPPLYTDLKQQDVGTVDGKDAEWFGPLIDTPTLRFLYDSAPYFHDGSARTLYETVTFQSPNSEHDVSSILTEEQIDDLIRFLLILPYGRK